MRAYAEWNCHGRPRIIVTSLGNLSFAIVRLFFFFTLIQTIISEHTAPPALTLRVSAWFYSVIIILPASVSMANRSDARLAEFSWEMSLFSRA
jgi:hypothetical protein